MVLTEAPMTTPAFTRTPDANFRDLPDYSFAPHYLDWRGLRVHYLDEGPRGAPVMLLLHGEPTWSYLYRRIIPRLVAAGHRCVAPDLVGFGKSDKVTDDSWYVIERHCETLRFAIERLDLRRVTLVCQDWGGPTGLRQAVDMPERFARLVIANTWLHHDDFEYSPGIRAWRAAATDPGKLGGDMPSRARYAALTTTRRRSHAPMTPPSAGSRARPARGASRSAFPSPSPKPATPAINSAASTRCSGTRIPCTSPSATRTKSSPGAGRSAGTLWCAARRSTASPAQATSCRKTRATTSRR
jgi:pimeloyl-ACP methyl ester carboxylesterase